MSPRGARRPLSANLSRKTRGKSVTRWDVSPLNPIKHNLSPSKDDRLVTREERRAYRACVDEILKEDRMASSDYGNAINQLTKLESFANVEDNLKEPPVCMPQDRRRAAGIDPDLWYGLGIVGVWAAIDAFGERKTGKRGQLQRFKNHVAAGQGKILSELDDLRSLFAHNFAGVADHLKVGPTLSAQLRLSVQWPGGRVHQARPV